MKTYTTPMEHNNPMEPHTTVARWADGGLTLYDSTQGVHSVQTTLAPLFGLDPARVHITAPHVGGGFGSKGAPHAHNVLAALAAQMVAGRPVKLALTRQQMFALAGYRTPTIQRIRLGADRQGHLSAIVHEVIEQTSGWGPRFARRTPAGVWPAGWATRTWIRKRASHGRDAISSPACERAPAGSVGIRAIGRPASTGETAG